MQSEIIIVPALFYAIYMAIRVLTDFFLKKKIINSGHFDRAGILSQGSVIEGEVEAVPEPSRYPSLKWGLVAFMAGGGFVLIDILKRAQLIEVNNYDAVLPIGIELMFISAGFLLYFFIVNFKRKTK